MPSTTLEILRARNLRATPQRIAVYEILKSRTDHPSVEAIYQKLKSQFPTMSLNTAYTALCALEKAGLIQRIDAGDGLCRYDGNPAPHVHLVCLRCLRVDDFDTAVGLDTHGLARQAEEATGYAVHDCAVYLHGVCPACGANNRNQ